VQRIIFTRWRAGVGVVMNDHDPKATIPRQVNRGAEARIRIEVYRSTQSLESRGSTA
jgi:hypothetical protein